MPIISSNMGKAMISNFPDFCQETKATEASKTPHSILETKISFKPAVTSEKLLVHDFPYSTSNFSESFHIRLKARIYEDCQFMWHLIRHINHLITERELG